MKHLFWKTYQVTFETKKRDFKNVMFFRGFTWEVVQLALKESKEKSDKEKIDWAVTEIKRI